MLRGIFKVAFHLAGLDILEGWAAQVLVVETIWTLHRPDIRHPQIVELVRTDLHGSQGHKLLH